MLDNALIKLIIATLVAGEANAGIPGTPIAQAFQPTMEGINDESTIYIHKIGDARYGSPFWQDNYSSGSGLTTHTENQTYETTFQLSTLATQNPITPDQYTASDICNLCAAILQSQASIQALQNAGVGIERITAVRNPYFLDDRQQNEAAPSFDFVLLHNQIISSPIPQSNTFVLNIDPVS